LTAGIAGGVEGRQAYAFGLTCFALRCNLRSARRCCY